MATSSCNVPAPDLASVPAVPPTPLMLEMTPVTVVLPVPPRVRVRPVPEASDKAMVPMPSVTVVRLLVRVLFWRLLTSEVIDVAADPARVRLRAPAAAVSARLTEESTSAAPPVRLLVRVRSAPLGLRTPPKVKLLVPETVRAAERTVALGKAFAPERSVPAWRVLVPRIVRLPLLRASLSPRIRMPSVKVVLPVKVPAALIATRPLVTPQVPASSLSARLPVPEMPVPEMVRSESASPLERLRLALPFRTTPPVRMRLLAESPNAKRAMLPALRLTAPLWVRV